MTDMIDRVAVAIGDACCEVRASQLRIAARAAIDAMREPTWEMLAAAGDMEGFGDYADPTDAARPHIEWWNKMIDAASLGQPHVRRFYPPDTD